MSSRYIRRDGSERGIHYSNGTRGPAGRDSSGGVVAERRAGGLSQAHGVPAKALGQDVEPPSAVRADAHKRWSIVQSDGRPLRVRRARPKTRRAPASPSRTWAARRRKSSTAIPRATCSGPQWSPNGERIIFGIGVFNAFFNGFHGLFLKPEDRAEGGAQVAMVNPDGSGFRELTSGPNNNGVPVDVAGRAAVRLPDVRSGGRRSSHHGHRDEEGHADRGGYDNFPLWSPRGDLIMFSRQADGDYEIYTIKPDGTGLKRLTHSRGNDAHMAWSPDGEHIVFASTRMGFKDEVPYTDAPQPYGEIFVMRADGSDIQQLTDNQWEEGTPAWQPTTRAATAR